MQEGGGMNENRRKFSEVSVWKAFLAAGRSCISLEIPTFQMGSQKVKTCLSISL